MEYLDQRIGFSQRDRSPVIGLYTETDIAKVQIIFRQNLGDHLISLIKSTAVRGRPPLLTEKLTDKCRFLPFGVAFSHFCATFFLWLLRSGTQKVCRKQGCDSLSNQRHKLRHWPPGTGKTPFVPSFFCRDLPSPPPSQKRYYSAYEASLRLRSPWRLVPRRIGSVYEPVRGCSRLQSRCSEKAAPAGYVRQPAHRRVLPASLPGHRL